MDGPVLTRHVELAAQHAVDLSHRAVEVCLAMLNDGYRETVADLGHHLSFV